MVLVGHSGAGKTTLLEAMLFAAGATHPDGQGRGRQHRLGLRRPRRSGAGISVSLALAPVEWDGVKINVLDAPGYADFIGDVRARCAPPTRACSWSRPWTASRSRPRWSGSWPPRRACPAPSSSTRSTASGPRSSGRWTSWSQAFGTQVAPIQLPIGEEHEFAGVVDLLSRRAYRYAAAPTGERGRLARGPRARRPSPTASGWRSAVAEADDALLEKYLEDRRAVRRGDRPRREGRARRGQVRAGPGRRGRPPGRRGPPAPRSSPTRSPRPLDRPPVTVVDQGRRRSSERATDPDGPLTALVFKTVSDPYVGRINLFRVYSGRVRPDSSVYNATKNTEERVGQLFAMRGKEHETVAEVPAGDIGAVAKLAHTTTGDTFSAKADPVTLPRDRAARTAAGHRHRAEDQGRRGQALHGHRPGPGGRPDAPGRALGRDARDRDVRHGRGARRHDGRADEAQVRRRGGHPPGQGPVQGDVQGTGQGAGPPREAVRRPRPVRHLQHRGRAAAPRGRVRVRRQDLRRGRSPTSSSPRSRRASSRRWPTGVVTPQPDGRHPGDARRREVPHRGLLGHGVPDRRVAGPQGGGGHRRASSCSSRSMQVEVARPRVATPATSSATSTPSAAGSWGWSRPARASSASRRWSRRPRCRATRSTCVR